MRFGIKSISMDDLCAELGISKKTLYQHVKNKNELIAETLDCNLTEHEVSLSGIENSDKDPIEQLLHFARLATEMLVRISPTTIHDLRKYHRSLWIDVDERRTKMIYSHMYKNLENGKAEGLYREDVDSDLIASLYVRMSKFMFDEKAIDASRERKIKLYFEFVKYHIRGIATIDGHKLLNQYEYFWHD